MLDHLLTPEAFEAWLQSVDTAIVGIAGDADNCPLACYLTDCTGWSVSAGGSKIEVNGLYEIAYPLWAADFAAAIDTHPHAVHADNNPVVPIICRTVSAATDPQ
jgi:hypothetical protein